MNALKLNYITSFSPYCFHPLVMFLFSSFTSTTISLFLLLLLFLSSSLSPPLFYFSCSTLLVFLHPSFFLLSLFLLLILFPPLSPFLSPAPPSLSSSIPSFSLLLLIPPVPLSLYSLLFCLLLFQSPSSLSSFFSFSISVLMSLPLLTPYPPVTPNCPPSSSAHVFLLLNLAPAARSKTSPKNNVHYSYVKFINRSGRMVKVREPSKCFKRNNRTQSYSHSLP